MTYLAQTFFTLLTFPVAVFGKSFILAANTINLGLILLFIFPLQQVERSHSLHSFFMIVRAE
jgi:hypothetical protein